MDSWLHVKMKFSPLGMLFLPFTRTEANERKRIPGLQIYFATKPNTFSLNNRKRKINVGTKQMAVHVNNNTTTNGVTIFQNTTVKM